MIRFIILMIVTIFVSAVIRVLITGSEDVSDKKDAVYFVTAEKGAIGCLSKEAFREEEGYYTKGDFAAAQKMLDEKICFFLANGMKMFAPEGTCSARDKDSDLFPFKPNDFMMLQPYLPCSAVR